MNSLVAKIDNELHSTRFLRNEYPPETHPLEYLRDSTKRRQKTGGQNRKGIQPRWRKGPRFDVPIQRRKQSPRE